MESRLIPLNAWLALLRGGGGWPSPLRDAGFRLHRLEAPVSTPASNLVADGIAVAEDRRVVLAVEAKSGSSIEQGQARRYAAMRPADVERQHGLPFPHQESTLELLYVCLLDAAQSIEAGLQDAGVEASILVIGDDQVELRPCHSSQLAAFKVPVPPGGPPALVRLDEESPDEEFREVLLPEIIAAAARGEELVAVSSILQRCMPFWDAYGSHPKRRLRDKAADVIRALASSGFSRDFRVEQGGSASEGPIARILRTPAAFDPRGETQGWQGLRRRGERTLRGRAPKHIEGQLAFEDLAREAESGEA